MPIHAQFYRSAIWMSKVGQCDLVFDVRSGFASGSVQDYKCLQRLRLVSPWLPKNFIRRPTFWLPVTLESRSNPTLLCIHVRCTHDANLVTPDSRDIAHKHFCDRLKPIRAGQGDLLFCVQSRFASGSLRARLQASVYSGYDLCHPICPKIWFV